MILAVIAFFAGVVTGVLFGRKNVAAANGAALIANRASAAAQAELNAIKAKITPSKV